MSRVLAKDPQPLRKTIANAISVLKKDVRYDRGQDLLTAFDLIHGAKGADVAERLYRSVLRPSMVDCETILLAQERISGIVQLLENAATGDNEMTCTSILVPCGYILQELAAIERAVAMRELA